MRRIDLIKKLLPGFIPLFVFIIADELWGTKIGIYVAVGVGVAELVYVALHEKRFDKFILFDTLLLVILGSVSLLLENDIFFKIKPGLVELILVVILGVSSFSSFNIVGVMSKRYMKGVEINEEQMIQFRRTLKGMFYIFLLHTCLVFYSAFYLSSEAWAFISGGLFYVIFAVYFLFEFFRHRLKIRKDENEEWLPIVDEKGKIKGKVARSAVHKGEKILHPVVHMHVIGKNKSVLLQKRPVGKLVEPGKWDVAVGGHISYGEPLEKALEREALEEIGLSGFSARLIKVFRWDTKLESELVYMFITFDSVGVKPNINEVEEVRFWTINQIKKNLGQGIFTPSLEHEIHLLQNSGII